MADLAVTLPTIHARPSTVTWITPEIQEARAARARPYQGIRGGLDEIVAAGLAPVTPNGLRVLLVAVLSEDVSSLMHVAYDARQAICFEVVAVSSACERWYDQMGVADDARDRRTVMQRLRAWFSGRGAVERARPRPGDHVWMVSPDADRISGSDPACRLFAAHPEDIPILWQKPAG